MEGSGGVLKTIFLLPFSKENAKKGTEFWTGQQQKGLNEQSQVCALLMLGLEGLDQALELGLASVL